MQVFVGKRLAKAEPQSSAEYIKFNYKEMNCINTGSNDSGIITLMCI